MRSQVAGFMVRLARQLPLGLALCIGVAAQAQVGRPTAAKLPPGPELDAVAAQGYHQQFKPAPGQKAFSPAPRTSTQRTLLSADSACIA